MNPGERGKTTSRRGILAHRPGGHLRPWAAVWALLAALLCTPLARAGDPAPQGFEALYRVEQAGLSLGEMRRSLRRRADGDYVYESLSRATGLAALLVRESVLERSVWRLRDGDAQPLRYEEEKTGGERDALSRVDFDWPRGMAIGAGSGGAWEMAVTPAVQDRLLYQFSLVLDLRRGASGPLEYSVADGGSLKHYRFRRLGEESLEGPLGRYQTVKLQHVREDKRRVTTLWCAPALDFMPVRVDQERDGSRRTAWLVELHGAAGTAAAESR